MSNKNKKFLIVINHLAIGGAERLIVDDINEMIRRGLSVKVLSLIPEKKDSFMDQCIIRQEDWELIDFSNYKNIKSWISCYRFLKKYKPDVVISHLWYPNTIIRLLSMVCFIPSIFTFEHNVYDQIKSRKCFIIDRFLQYKSDYIIAVSDAVKRSLIRHGIKKERIRVILNAIDIARYHATINEEYYKNLGINKDDFVFIFLGRLTYQKGVDVLLRAFSKLNSGILLLLGDGPDGGPLRQMSVNLNLTHRVRFLSRRKDVAELMAIAKCGVFPSRWEGLPMVLLETMACHVPIISTDFESAREIIIDDYNAIVVKRDDDIALSIAMRQAMTDEKLRDKLISNGIVTVSNFSIEKHVDNIIGLIDIKDNE